MPCRPIDKPSSRRRHGRLKVRPEKAKKRPQKRDMRVILGSWAYEFYSQLRNNNVCHYNIYICYMLL